MASDRTTMLGQRAELRQKRQRQAATVEALRDTLRGMLLPTLLIAHVDGNKVLDIAASFQWEKAELETMDSQLAILNRELGE